MNQDNIPNYSDRNNIDTEEAFDYKSLAFKLLRYWYFFVLTVFIALIIAFLFNKYTKPVYEISTTLLINDSRGGAMDSQDLIGIGFGGNGQNVQNEVGKLKSYSLVFQTIKNLDFDVTYIVEDNFVNKELYHDNPFEVIFDTSHLQPVNVKFQIEILSEKQFTLRVQGKDVDLYDYSAPDELVKELEQKEDIEIDKVYSFGEMIEDKAYRFKVVLTDHFDNEESLKNYFFSFNKYESLTKNFRNFEVEPIDEQASILKITSKTNNKKKAVAFLNTLTRVYLEQNLEKKNQVATNTIKFIEGELSGISDSLDFVERRLEEFRTRNKIVDLSYQSQRVYEQINELEQERLTSKVHLRYYEELLRYIDANSSLKDVLIVPSSIGIQDELINKLTANLLELYSKKEDKLMVVGSENIEITKINNQIALTEKNLLENIRNIIKRTKTSLVNVEGRIAKLNNEIAGLPRTQRELVGIQRNYSLSTNMYNYLQQKKSEAQITKASNQPDNEIIDIARDLGESPVFPKKSMNYMIAFILGLILPTLYILGKDYFNDTFVDRKDIEKLTKYPIVGQIMHSYKDTQAVVAESPKSSISESFRSVRTNLLYTIKGKDQHTVLVTADMVSAGKTFISINLASVYALYGKRTLLMGFDLRKPKIYKDFGLSNAEGISSYLINKSSIEDIIQHSPIENLDIVMAGPVPPNPAELIASERTKELIDE